MAADHDAPVGPSVWRMLARGILRRCPWCGDHRAWFRGWFGRRERCRRCGLRWDRNTDGHEIGALTVNIVLIFATLLLAMAIGIVATAPDIAVVPLVIGLGVAAVVGPIIAYPLSYTIWMAFDIAARRPSTEELAANLAALAPPPAGAGDGPGVSEPAAGR